MDSNLYFIKRIGSAKMIGMVFGLVGFFMIPSLWPDQSIWLRIGVLLWYTTFGAMIGIVGMFDHHPLLKFRMPCWFRGLVFGAWLNLVLTFLMHDKLSVLMQQLDGVFGGIRSPFWIVLEGAVLGLVIDAAATKIAGEGIPASGRPVA
jgi:hypothetical protein